MMLNKMPPNTSLHSVLEHLESATKHGIRNRAMFVIRQSLRIRDISALLVSDVLGLDGKIRNCYMSQDGQVFRLDDQLKKELHRYLLKRFMLSGNSLRPLLQVHFNLPLFPTQKRERFSNNTLAQHFSYLDKSIRCRFEPRQASKRSGLIQRIKSAITSVT